MPFTPDDLPGYAAALFDHLIGRPQLMQDPSSPERLAAHRAAVATAVRALTAAAAVPEAAASTGAGRT